MSLWVLNGRDVPDDSKRATLEMSYRWLRVAARLGADGRQGDVARLYRATGELVHEQGTPFDGGLVDHVLTETGTADVASAVDDAALDGAVEASTAAALDAAGPGAASVAGHPVEHHCKGCPTDK